jgi:CRISPR type III-B/RAMP module RAMP protein Cmr6
METGNLIIIQENNRSVYRIGRKTIKDNILTKQLGFKPEELQSLQGKYCEAEFTGNECTFLSINNRTWKKDNYIINSDLADLLLNDNSVLCSDNFGFELNNDIQYQNLDGKLKAIYYQKDYPSITYTNDLLDAKNAEKKQVVECLYDLYVKDTFKPNKALLIGTGDASPWDIGIRLNHPHGYPYIPASSIQGMLRSYMIQYVFQKNEDLAMQDEGFYLIFGGERDTNSKKEYRKGLVDFEDALPNSLSNDAIVKQVFTNHYQDYYLDKAQPTDTLNPVPIFYLTVGSSVSFHIYYGIRYRSENEAITSGEFMGFKPLSIVTRFLSLAFAHQGVGARTKNNFGKGEFNPSTFQER